MALLLRPLVLLFTAVSRVAAGQAPAPSRPIDTAAVVAAAWQSAAAGHAGLRSAVLAPSAFGPRVISALRARGVVVRADTAPAGPDTAVFWVTRLEPRARGVTRVALESAWEEHRGGCAYGSGNAEARSVRCRAGRCRATPAPLDGPVLHGDASCRRLPSAASPR